MAIRKQTILAYSLTALACLMAGFFIGQESVKYANPAALQDLAVSVSHTPSASRTSDVPGQGSSSHVAEVSTSTMEMSAAAVKERYIQQNLKLYDLHASYTNSMLDDKVPGVTFKIKNNGTRTLIEVDVTVYFKDASGRTISEASYTPVFALDSNFGKPSEPVKHGYVWHLKRLEDHALGVKNEPLKPGYIWQMERGKFYAAKSVPSEWKPGSVTAKITNIEFASSGYGDGG